MALRHMARELCPVLSDIEMRLLLKITGMVQVLSAMIVTSLSIAITVKYHTAEGNVGLHDFEIDPTFINNPWTTVYGGGVMMGLVTYIAGLLEVCIDLRPDKGKYKYFALAVNSIVFVYGIVLIHYSVIAMAWFDHRCGYVTMDWQGGYQHYYMCPLHVRYTGKVLYTIQVFFLLVNIASTACMVVIILANDPDLIRDCTPSRIRYYFRERQDITEPQVPTTIFQEGNELPSRNYHQTDLPQSLENWQIQNPESVFPREHEIAEVLYVKF